MQKKPQNDILGQTAMDPNLQAVTVEIQFLDLGNSQKLKHHLLSLLFLKLFFQYFVGWANVKSRKRSGDIIRYYCATFVKLFAPLLAFTET